MFIVQLVIKFHWNSLKTEGGQENFSETDPVKSAYSRISIFARKLTKLKYFANFSCRVVFLMYPIIILMFGWKLCSKFNFTTVLPILANFSAFRSHTKETVDIRSAFNL